MFVSCRKLGETLVIDDDVTITVLEIRGKFVRIGIEAPQSLSVHRGEETWTRKGASSDR